MGYLCQDVPGEDQMEEVEALLIKGLDTDRATRCAALQTSIFQDMDIQIGIQTLELHCIPDIITTIGIGTYLFTVIAGPTTGRADPSFKKMVISNVTDTATKTLKIKDTTKDIVNHLLKTMDIMIDTVITILINGESQFRNKSIETAFADKVAFLVHLPMMDL